MFKQLPFVIMAGSICVSSAVAVGQDLDATAALMTEVRHAVGGDGILRTVHSFTISGRTSHLFDTETLTGQFKIDCILPDQYLFTETVRIGRGSITHSNGFNGSTPIERIQNALPGTLVSGQSGDLALLMSKQDLARLLIGFFGDGVMPVKAEFRYVGDDDTGESQTSVFESTPGTISPHASLSIATFTCPCYCSGTPPIG